MATERCGSTGSYTNDQPVIDSGGVAVGLGVMLGVAVGGSGVLVGVAVGRMGSVGTGVSLGGMIVVERDNEGVMVCDGGMHPVKKIAAKRTKPTKFLLITSLILLQIMLCGSMLLA